jgi:minor extracellular serine protease Vpr
MLRSIVIPLLLVAVMLSAQTRMPATTLAGIQELQALAMEHDDPVRLVQATQGHHPTALIHGRCMAGFLGKIAGELDMGDEHQDAFIIGSRTGNILSFRLDVQQLHLLETIQGLEYVELAGRAAPTLDKTLRSTRVDSVHMGVGLPSAYTGADVYIGITDWGFDYTQPMFYDTTLTQTRIRAAWDQYKLSGPAPAMFNYGTEYSTAEALLAAQSDTANIYSFATHGSHVAGIAGGSGAGTAYRGVAFESQFLFCTFLIDAAAVLDAFTWMQQIAQQDGKRLVINMSWGLHHMGTLDGQSLLSQAIDQMSQQGIVFVSSAGNNGDVNFHIGKEFQNDTIKSRVQFYPYNAHQHMWGQSISMWGEAGASFSAGITITNNTNAILLESPWYHTNSQQPYLDSILVHGNDTIQFNLAADAAHPLNGRPHFRLRVRNTHNNLKVVLKATAATGTVHFWNVTELTNGVGNWGQAFQATATGWVAGDAAYGIAEPAAAESLIAVAAYNGESVNASGNVVGGDLASFSSYGPTLDGRVKPDIAAPGVSVASSISAFTNASITPVSSISFQGMTYPFARFSGTSMSSPAVAGIVALLLEADPTLAPAEIKDILKATARTDNNTGIIPPGGDLRWGWGKVNAYKAVLDVLGITGMVEMDLPPPFIWPNPATSEVWVRPALDGVPANWRVMDLYGRTIASGEHFGDSPLVIAIMDWAAGIYVIQIEQQGSRSTARFTRS